jgi:hypothetical protein
MTYIVILHTGQNAEDRRGNKHQNANNDIPQGGEGVPPRMSTSG